MKRLRLFLLAFGCAAAIQGALLAAGIVINDTPSLPEGFYQKTSRPVGKGSFVLLCLPPGELSARPYARGLLLKQIVAVPGDRVCIDAAGVTVNGQPLVNSAQLAVDRDGAPLPRLALTDYTVRENEVLAMSTYNPRSFDGRYFGPLQRGSILAVVEPRLTW
ncbi:MAG: conjugative transfer signal peptidase TraF [Rhodospirillales bacterium]|nr:conjugative transfer signal peptidase TraF [Acetobacter sp.]